MKLKLLLLIIISPLLLLTGCKPVFTFNGSILNYDIYKTIYVSEFPIRASLVYPPLQQTFENEILNYVTRQTKLQIADNPNNADINLTGEITGYSLSPQAVGTDAYATETRLTISVRVKYTDNKNSANNID
ncbi:MAG: hypothetical protein K2M39_05455, partial [Muribaculaceae bacterium]|nr:hypothetical protein [Muribaculaceae bacterium]